MSNFTYLFTASNPEGDVFVFRADNAYFAEEGDLIEYLGDMFVIRKVNHISLTGDDYEMIADLAEIRDADAIYVRKWCKPPEGVEEIETA